MPRSLLALALLVPFAPSAEATCAQSMLVPRIATTRDTHLPADGGVLVSFTYATSDPEPTGSDPSEAKKWTATSGKKAIALTRTSLAPGLSVYRPAADVGSFDIADSKGNKLGSFTHDTSAGAASKLVAPEPVKLAVSTTRGFRSTTTTATLDVKTAPPPDAVAVIIYDVSSGTPEALSFAGLPDSHDTLKSFEVFQSGGHCANDVPGQHAPGAGLKVAVAYVDAFGRLSPQSKPFTAK